MKSKTMSQNLQPAASVAPGLTVICLGQLCSIRGDLGLMKPRLGAEPTSLDDLSAIFFRSLGRQRIRAVGRELLDHFRCYIKA